MAKRKTMSCGDDPLIIPVSHLKRQCTEENSNVAQLVSSPDDSGHVEEGSCCLSNGSVSELEQDQRGENVEEVETLTCDLGDEYRSNTTNSSEMDPPPEQKSPPPTKAPPKDEIEKFFAAFEEDNQKYYTEKYNYDFVKDIPLEGRYEWVLVKP